MTKKTIRILAALLLGCAGGALAAVPGLINFQGRLLDNNKLPRSGSYAMTFQICSSASDCSSPLWSEVQPAVTVTNGLFAVQLGAVSPLTPSVFSADTRYLEITVGAETLLPREQLATGAYSFRSAVADSLLANVPVSSVAVNSVLDNSIVGLSSSKLSGALPVLDGSALTGVTASAVTAANVTAGTLGALVVASSVPAANIGVGKLGAQVVASSVAVNAVQDNSIVGMTSSKLSGALPAISGASLTGVTAAAVAAGNVTAGTLGALVVASSVPAANIGVGDLGAQV
ncbi:MAG: hypothetical protein HY952_07165, partial [Elusimicrobia bacterium]|nr:hypothetical protein [Elusimicrobiota bacterium]